MIDRLDIQFLIGFFLFSPGIVSSKANNTSGKPNIVFILADDLGWADLPVYGNLFNEAPNLNKLATEGMRFTNAYAACPVCSPTRASIQSGQYPARVGVIDFIPGHWRPYEKVIVPKNRTQYLPQKIITIGEAIKDAGYATGYFGKWHLGNDIKHHPLNQGFDEANVGQGFYNVKFNPPREMNSSKRFTELLADFGEEFIEKNKDHPFFLFLAHFDVHVKLDADRDLIDKYLRKEKVVGYPCNAVYGAMIEHLDKSVGRILNKLEALGLAENTIVIFYSDNGGVISENSYPQFRDSNVSIDKMFLLADTKNDIYKDDPLRHFASSNAPLRGEKGSVYEGGIREPLIVRWPDKIQSGSVSNAIVSSVDFFPTLIEAAGGKLPDNQILDGQSIIPELLGKNTHKDRAVFWHYPIYHHDIPAGAIRKGDWKLIENMETGNVSLYNLIVDISETTNLSKTYPEKTQELYSLLKKWQKEVNAEFPLPNPDFDKNKRDEWGVHPDRK